MKRSSIIILALAMISPLMAGKNEKSYWFQRAEEAYEKQDYGKCMRACEAGVRENPKDAYCWAVIAEICSKRAFAQYGRALEAADEALKYLPKKETYWIGFVHAIRGDVFYKVGEPEQSAQAYEKAVAMMPDKIEYIYALADVYRDLKRYEDAQVLLKRIVDEDPAESYVQAVLADNYLSLGDTLNAMRRVNLSLALDPDDNEMAQLVLFRIAWARGDVLQATNQYLQILHSQSTEIVAYDSLRRDNLPLLLAATRLCINEAPTDPVRLCLLASIYYKEGQCADAYIWQKKAVKLSDEYEGMLLTICSDLGLWNEVDELFRKEMKNDSTVRLGMAYHYARRGDYQTSYQQNLLVRNDYSTEEYIYRGIARVLTNMQRYDEAIAYMDTAVIMADEQSQATMLFNRGEIYTRMGDDAKAMQDYLAAREVVDKPDTKAFVDALLGNKEQVEQYVDSVVPTLTDNDDFFDIASIYACMHDKNTTIRYMRKAYEHGMRIFPYDRAFRFSFLQDDPDWQALLNEIEQTRQKDIAYIRRQEQAEETSGAITQIPFEKKGGVNQVQCTINGLALYFVFDTGASDVSLSNVEANFMLRNGYLTEQDFMGKQNYVTATGEIHEGTIVNLREVRVGDIILTNIKASVVKNQNAPLLLGQSVFRRFGTVEVDNNASVIRFVK